MNKEEKEKRVELWYLYAIVLSAPLQYPCLVFSSAFFHLFATVFSVISFQFQQYKLYPNGYYGSVWVQIILHLHFQWFFFSFFAAHVSGDKVTVHALFMGPSITLLKKNKNVENANAK